MERCPNCAARLTEAPVCRRCGMDLGGLLATEQAAEQLLGRAVADLRTGDYLAARRALRRSLSLRDTALARHLLGLVTERLAELSEEDQAIPPAPAARPQNDRSGGIDVLP